jgi:hypothetical protein
MKSSINMPSSADNNNNFNKFGTRELETRNKKQETRNKRQETKRKKREKREEKREMRM